MFLNGTTQLIPFRVLQICEIQSRCFRTPGRVKELINIINLLAINGEKVRLKNQNPFSCKGGWSGINLGVIGYVKRLLSMTENTTRKIHLNKYLIV